MPPQHGISNSPRVRAEPKSGWTKESIETTLLLLFGLALGYNDKKGVFS
jgi:hypothetical protein